MGPTLANQCIKTETGFQHVSKMANQILHPKKTGLFFFYCKWANLPQFSLIFRILAQILQLQAQSESIPAYLG